MSERKGDLALLRDANDKRDSHVVIEDKIIDLQTKHNALVDLLKSKGVI